MTSKKPVSESYANAADPEAKKKKKKRSSPHSGSSANNNDPVALDFALDAAEIGLDAVARNAARAVPKGLGQGGKFSGGGATGHFDDVATAVAPAVIAPDAEAVTEAASTATEAASGLGDAVLEALQGAGGTIADVAGGAVEIAGNVGGAIAEGIGEVLSGLGCTSDPAAEQSKPMRRMNRHNKFTL